MPQNFSCLIITQKAAHRQICEIIVFLFGLQGVHKILCFFPLDMIFLNSALLASLLKEMPLKASTYAGGPGKEYIFKSSVKYNI